MEEVKLFLVCNSPASNFKMRTHTCPTNTKSSLNRVDTVFSASLTHPLFCLDLFCSSELENERRALEESHHEKRVLASRVDDLSTRLQESERERRQVRT